MNTEATDKKNKNSAFTNAKWIKSPSGSTVSPCFLVNIKPCGKIRAAKLHVSAIGMYAAFINNARVGNYVFAPGWTSYFNQTQYQEFDVTDMITDNSELKILLGKGWAVGCIGFNDSNNYFSDHTSVIFSLDIEYENGITEIVSSDESCDVYTSNILDSEIYHGEIADNTAPVKYIGKALPDEVKTTLVPQIGEIICEQERIFALSSFKTPAGDTVIDFGQNLTGYVEVKLTGKKGTSVSIRHAEILDKDGNFYTGNLRTAKQTNVYTKGTDEDEIFKPLFSFQGFRYISVDGIDIMDINTDNFLAIAVHSNITRTGYFTCGNKKINQLYHNIIWGQKGNYLDVPTDCPQRNERLGWLGDAQVFVRTGAINYNVEKFFKKWLSDVALEQYDDGSIEGVTPVFSKERVTRVSSGWGDAAVICPWQIYKAYGNTDILINQFNSMKKWVDYMHSAGPEEFLWLGANNYGDWLALDSEEGSYTGATNQDFIASCYFAYSNSLFIKAGKILGKDMSDYEELYENTVNAIKQTYIKDGLPIDKTQTACSIVLYFDLCDDRKKVADYLAKLVRENENRLTTGFLGTPYLLHALSDNGYTKVAYDLLLQEAFPSWLYSVNNGATTIWEHWDGVKVDGSFWSDNMNSFNHYAYGAVADWLYCVVAGVIVEDDGAGYTHILLKPSVDERLGFINCSIETRQGTVTSNWYIDGENIVHFEFSLPDTTVADITLPSGKTYTVEGGSYLFAEQLKK